MVVKSRNFTQDEIIEGLRKALRVYADPHHSVWDDLNRDDCSGFYKQPGETARQALNLYSYSTTTNRPKNLGVEVGSLRITQIGDNKHSFEVQIDGVPQEKLTRVQVDISVDGSVVRLDRAI